MSSSRGTFSGAAAWMAASTSIASWPQHVTSRLRRAVPAGGGRTASPISRAARARTSSRRSPGGCGLYDRGGRKRRLAARRRRPQTVRNMILSRLPVGRILRHALPWEADPATRNMPRGLLDVEVVTAHGLMRVMTTHLEYFSAALRQSQINGIAEIVRRNAARARGAPQPAAARTPWGRGTASTILTGDFNLRSDDPARARLTTPLRAAAPGCRMVAGAASRRTPSASFCIADQTYGPPHCCDFLLVSTTISRRGCAASPMRPKRARPITSLC